MVFISIPENISLMNIKCDATELLVYHLIY